MRQVEENYSPVQLEEDIRRMWERTRTYEKVKRAYESARPYYILDGPPYTTGSIHIGTAWNKILKDTIIRFRRMQGLQVRDQPGYDMHGLPIEVKVEQSMGIKTKKEIEERGIDTFVSTCKEFANKFKSKMTDEFKSLGVWMDWERPYQTVDSSYMESIWWTLKQAHDKGLLAMDLRVLPWCPRCETALAEAEIEYWDETDPSIFVKFPLVGSPGEFLLVWTTTPWTIPGNLAAAVHPDFTYAKVVIERGGSEDTVILLEEKTEELRETAQIESLKILETMKGSDLVGLEYKHPLAELVPYQQHVSGEWVHKVVASDTVAAESTGIVHIAPGHGPEDFDIGLAHDIEPFSPVDDSGNYTDDAGEHYGGRNVKEASSMVVNDLVERGMLFHQGTITHRYGHCWRCKNPIIYRITDQWFLKVTAFKAELDDANSRVKWYPEWAGSSREKDWIANARDWCISRQRYWGTPLPVWKCPCGNERVVSTLNELRESDAYTEGMDLHRPWIDAITFKCEKCSGVMTRVKDVLDVWFDAGVCSWASLGYPASKDEFDKWWPSEWITEAHDQTRGWFYSQLVTGVMALGKSPFKSVLMHGWALNPQGEAMSKSDGTAIDPVTVVNTFGSDSLRLYLLKANAPWEDIQFQQDGVKAANRTLNILWNVYKFATLYMSIDKFDPHARSLDQLKDHMMPEDRWMMSRIESVKRDFSANMEIYEIHRALRLLEEFIVDDLSRWYVKLVRDRLWKEGENMDKIVAFKVLHESLTTSSVLLAPVAPHISEAIHQNLDNRSESVHLAKWPSYESKWIDKDIEEGMALVREISEVLARVRQEANVNLRWPLKRVVVKCESDDDTDALLQLKKPMLNQNNVKNLQMIPIGEEWDEMVLSVVPNPNAIGKVYRQWSSKIAVLLKNRPAKAIKAGIDKGEYSLGIEGQLVKILPNMVSFTSTLPPEVIRTEFSRGVMYIDLEETPALEAEGFARELIRRIQQMRKDMGMDIEEFIRVEIDATEKLKNAIETWREHISRETRCRQLEIVDSPKGEYVVEWSVANEQFTAGLTSLKMKDSLKALMGAEGITLDKAMAILDAGFTTLDSLRSAPQEDFAVVDGISKLDAKRMFDTLHKDDAKPAAEPPTQPEADSIPEPVKQETAPSPVELEPPAEDMADQELERSFSYLVEEDKPDTSYHLFIKALDEGMKGFCVTRNYPAKIKSKFDLKDTPVMWLSNVGRDNAIRPKDLEKLSLALEQFLSQEGGGIVLLDGLEYLITNNNFITVLRLIQSLRDQVAINQSILLMAVNRSTLESHQLNLLEREVDRTING